MSHEWEEILDTIDKKIEEERKIWSSRLKDKIDELRVFKQEMLKMREPAVDLLQMREKRLRDIEHKLEDERQCLLNEETARKETEEKLRRAQNKLVQLEKENEYFQKQVQKKTEELTQIRKEYSPRLTKASRGPNEQIQQLEEQIQETERFYQRISERIDKLFTN